MKLLKKLSNDYLYTNSLWLIGSTVILTGFGFFFWTICARLFSSEQVGVASTLISVLELLAALSILGFNVALIKYVPQAKEKNHVILFYVNFFYHLSLYQCYIVKLVFK